MFSHHILSPYIDIILKNMALFESIPTATTQAQASLPLVKHQASGFGRCVGGHHPNHGYLEKSPAKQVIYIDLPLFQWNCICFFICLGLLYIVDISRIFKIWLTGQYERVGHIANNTSATCNVDIRRLKPTSKAYVFVHTANGPELGPQDHGNQMEPIGPLWTTLFNRCNPYIHHLW